MNRYREMTNEELSDWALDFRTSDKAASRLIYAMAMRLKAEEERPEPAPKEEPAPPRPEGLADLVKQGKLSREARAWLTARHPARLHEVMRHQSTLSGLAARPDPMGGRVCQGLAGMPGFGLRRPGGL